MHDYLSILVERMVFANRSGLSNFLDIYIRRAGTENFLDRSRSHPRQSVYCNLKDHLPKLGLVRFRIT